MKTFFMIAVFTIITLLIVSCSGRYVLSTEPNRPTYVRPVAPGPDYVWVEGDWRKRKGRYVWFEGHWVKNKMNRDWQPGYWTARNDNWYWKRGRWN